MFVYGHGSQTVMGVRRSWPSDGHGRQMVTHFIVYGVTEDTVADIAVAPLLGAESGTRLGMSDIRNNW